MPILVGMLLQVRSFSTSNSRNTLRAAPEISSSAFREEQDLVSASSSEGRASKLPTGSKRFSLGGKYLIEYGRTRGDGEISAEFRLIPLHEISFDPEAFPSASSQAWAALHHGQPTGNGAKSEPIVLNAEVVKQIQADSITLRCSYNRIPTDVDDVELLDVLSRVLLQSLWFQMHKDLAQNVGQTVIHSKLPNGTQETIVLSAEQLSTPDILSLPLFQKYMNTQSSEMVPMVDQTGYIFGYVPRKLVHVHNLLHCGVGILVTDGKDNIYCHRRTETKRIFPNLYDMFVGGVSVAGERDSYETAKRELQEELGLCDIPLQFLWQCIVCTTYNRCVVSVFRCQANANSDITWQPDEVAWGAWVSSGVVEAAADRSIMRCVDWPGRFPKIQSEQKGQLASDGYFNGDWTEWDFVPDGLLVWEAWLRAKEPLA